MAEHEDDPIVGMDGSRDEADEPEIAGEAPDQRYSEDELEEFARTVEEYLSKCANEQPYDEGAPIWLNQHTTLYDVMERADVPEECREEVAQLVQCPSCSGPHELWEQVGVKSDGELRYEDLMDKWYASHSDKLDAFDAFLEKFPYLGATHDFGKEIRAGIAQFPLKTIDDAVFYRARRITNGRDYTHEDFLPPDPAKHPVGEGRYSHAGQSVMYLADDKDGAAIECLNEDESRAWVQAFRVKAVEKILDLSDEEEWADEDTTMLACGLTHSGAVRRLADRANSWKPEYFVPRFIADCARERGFNGIRFKSVRHWRTNLVLFSYDPAKVIPEGEPEIIRVENWKRSDWMYKEPADLPIPIWTPGTASHEELDKLIEP